MSGQAEYQRGEQTKNDDFMLSGLASWRRGNFGILASAGYSDLTLGNNYAGTAPAGGGEGTASGAARLSCSPLIE